MKANIYLLLVVLLVSGCSELSKLVSKDESPVAEARTEAEVEIIDHSSEENFMVINTEGDLYIDEEGEIVISDNKLQSTPIGRADINSDLPPNTPPPPVNRIVYFDFDSSSMDTGVKNKITTHAQYLLANPKVRIRLEGHADERGSREYNLGLGELRALAVRDLLELEGVNSTRMFVISYGEEKPVGIAHNQKAWQKNRRVEIVY